MSGGRRLLLWLARERPPSASPRLRALSKTIGWLVPVCALALVVVRQLVAPDAPAEPYKTAYPDLCERTPAALVAAAVPDGVRSTRILDRDSSECSWTDPAEHGAALIVRASRPNTVFSGDAPIDEAVELYDVERDDAENATGDDSPDPVGGLGDEAAWYSSEGDPAVGVLVVRWGMRVLSVELSAVDVPPETVGERVVEVARAVLPALPAD